MEKRILDTTLRTNSKTKERLENLDFVRKTHTYNDIITKLIEEYESFRKIKGAK